MLLEWLRRWLCRCPEPEPTIQATGNMGGTFSFDAITQYQAEGSIAPPPAALYGPPPAAPPPRHLRLVDGADVPAQGHDDPS